MNTLVNVAIFVSVAILGAWSCDPNAVRACTADHKPVCATFKKTFPNRCSMEAALCALAKEGFDFTEEVSHSDCCNRICTLEHSRTCGSDGRIYSNKCMMGTARCQKRDWIEEVDISNCEASEVEK